MSDNRDKVVMTGEGVDELMFGYDIFREQACLDFIKSKPNSKWRYKSIDSLYSYLPQFKSPRYRRLAIDSLMQAGEYSILNPLKSRLSSNLRTLSVAPELSSEDLISSIIMEYKEDNFFKELDELGRIQKFEIDNLLGGYLLSSQGDRVTMAHSIEGRYPFLDLEFVKYLNWKFHAYGNLKEIFLRGYYAGHIKEEYRPT